jgi:cytochrome c-type biogenesis protein CcmF
MLGALRSTTVTCGVISLAVACGVGFYMGGPLTGVLGLALGLWLVTSSIASLVKRLGGVGPAFRLGRISTIPRAYWGMFTAHIGFAILVLGITGVSTWQQEAGSMMAPGQRIELAGYTLVLDGVERVKGPNYDAERGTFRVLNGDTQIGLLTPEVRQYTAPPMTTTEAAIMPRLLGDIYVAIGNPDDLGRWGVRLYFKPMVLWLWSGAIIMFLGGLLSLTDRRIRIGIPLRLRRPVSVAPEGVA